MGKGRIGEGGEKRGGRGGERGRGRVVEGGEDSGSRENFGR